MPKILTFWLLVLLLAGCKKTEAPAADGGGVTVAAPGDAGVANGTPVEPAPVGPQKAEGALKDGLKDGPWTYWHDNGQKAAAGDYRAGNKHGKWTYWHSNGQKDSEGEYIDSKKTGTWTEWDENGAKTSERQYKDGMEFFP